MQKSSAVLDLWLRKNRSGISHDYSGALVFEKLHFEKAAFKNPSVFGFDKLRFCEGLA